MLSSNELVLNGPIYASYRKNGELIYFGKLLKYDNNLFYYYFENLSGPLYLRPEDKNKKIFVDMSPSVGDVFDECVDICCWLNSSTSNISAYNWGPVYESK